MSRQRTPPSPDCYDYVRRTYHVPAFIGTRVRVGERCGVLVRARSDLHYVHVRFDDARHSVPAHPTDVEYLPVGQEAHS